MQPQPPDPVPTSQRSINGTVLSGAALSAYGLATYYGAPGELAVAGALAVGALFSTLGDASRGRLEKNPPKTFTGEVVLKLLARIG